jgi:hypothetical protein
MQLEQGANWFSRAKRLDWFSGHNRVGNGFPERPETISRQPTGEQSDGPYRLQSAVLDRMHPLAAARSNDAFTIDR